MNLQKNSRDLGMNTKLRWNGSVSFGINGGKN